MSRRFVLLAGLLPALLLCSALAIPSVTAQDEAPKTETPAAEAPAAPEAAKAETPAEAGAAAPAEEAAEAAPAYPLNETEYAFDNMMLMLCAVLVLFMQSGFALVETGLNASKNAVNIMFKNFGDLCIGVLLYFIIGYGLMYPGDSLLFSIKDMGVLGFGGSGIAAETDGPVAANLHSQADFLFQAAFAATAATIVSGCVAGRMKFGGYLIYTAVITAFIYPISGMWKWGGGWLAELGFVDFAGSLVVHAVGGCVGLAGAIVLGPRIGRYVNGKSVPIPGHNIPYAALGTFILIIGWFGFNPGSQLAFTGKANVDLIMMIAVNTLLAACAGGFVATFLSWGIFKKPDLTMALNGSLAGLVGITANCHTVSNNESIIIGAVAGAFVIGAIMLLDKLKIDDPVGASPVHGFCGLWGGLATGIFGDIPEGMTRAGFLQVQAIGCFAIIGWALLTGFALFYALKALNMLRVPAEEELTGLDITEHGMYAYPPQLVVDFPGSGGSSGLSMSHAMAGHAKPSTEAV